MNRGVGLADVTLNLDPEPHCNFPAPHPQLTDWHSDVSSSQPLSTTKYRHVNSMPALNQAMEYQNSCDVT